MLESPALQRTPAEAAALVERGRKWNAGVWMSSDFLATRGELIQGMNALLAGWGSTATVGHGIFKTNPYDPVVRTGKALPYRQIVNSARAEPDGGVHYARLFLAWCTDSGTRLVDLPPPMLALALITRWAEVGRGYHSELSRLYDWVGEIAAAPDRATARRLWADVDNRYPPALTYRADTSTDFEPSDEPMDTDEDMPLEPIPADELAALQEEARDFLTATGPTTRSRRAVQ